MAEPKPLPLGPWPLGVNNVDDLQAPVFQPPTQPSDPPAQLRLANNVDLDRHGRLRLRQGRTKRLSLIDGRALASFGDVLLLVDGNTLYRVESNGWNQTVIADELPLNTPIIWTEHGGSIWWACGEKRGSIRQNEPFHWGLPTPQIVGVSEPLGGNIAVGSYLVTVTTEQDGLESGAMSPVYVKDLPHVCGINIYVAEYDAEKNYNVYISTPNGSEVYRCERAHRWSDKLSVYALPTMEPCETLLCHPPPEGQLLVGFGGRLLIGAENILYWSMPGAYHHWRIGLDLQLFPDRLTLLAPLDGGFYVGTEREVYFIQGDDPENWTPRHVDAHPAIEGTSLRIDGRKLQELQYSGVVQIWATTDGLAAGLPDGTVRHLTDSRLAIDPHQHATLAYREERGLRQILMGLRERQAANSFGASDTATCRVVRAQST